MCQIRYRSYCVTFLNDKDEAETVAVEINETVAVEINVILTCDRRVWFAEPEQYLK